MVDPAFAIEQYLESAKREGCGSSACSRRTRMPTTCPATAGSPSSTASGSHPPRRARLRLRTAGGRRRDRRGLGLDPGRPHARPPARALRVHGQRPSAQRRAVADADRRLTLRRRGGPTGSRRRGRRGRARAVPASSVFELPDGVEVHPGHVSGSLCGAGMDHKRSTTIGFERRFNRAFAHQGEDEFVAESIRAGVRPPNMERIVELNRGPFSARPSRSGR